MNLSWRIDRTVRTEPEARRIISQIASWETLVQSGGFLFQAHVGERTVSLAMLPVISGTRRNYHHEIDLEKDPGTETWPRIVGTFLADLTVQLLVPPRSSPTSHTDTETCIQVRQITRFCRALISAGFPPERRFESVTRGWFRDLGVYSEIPETVGDAAESEPTLPPSLPGSRPSA